MYLRKILTIIEPISNLEYVMGAFPVYNSEDVKLTLTHSLPYSVALSRTFWQTSQSTDKPHISAQQLQIVVYFFTLLR